jgi:hypothetical protein
MDSIMTNRFPAQQLSFAQKGKKWRRECVDFATNRAFWTDSAVRNSVIHKKINYKLYNGQLDMSDVESVINPTHLDSKFVPETIQHYPILRPRLEVLIGEEAARVFDCRVIVTNPNAISEMEEAKKAEVLQQLQSAVENTSQSDEEFQQRMNSMGQYFSYDYQDFREIRANALLNHYSKEQNFKLIFNKGFEDALIVGEEIYQCDVVGGEPVLEKLNPMKVRVMRSGYSNKLEDADIIVLEDYWSPGKVVDTYYDVLTEKDRKYIEDLSQGSSGSGTDKDGNIDETLGFVNLGINKDTIKNKDQIKALFGRIDEFEDSSPYDFNGNIRVMKVFWKSRRKVKKVKSYDPQTGEETFDFYPETYIVNKALGETEEIMWINEAWEGTKIGTDVYVNIRPRPIQYNRLGNPSRCHFGIIGSVYNNCDGKPYSLVDMMKPYSYLYDAVHDRLLKALAHNYGRLLELDLSKKPDSWDVDKWLYFARRDGLYVTNSFNEGHKGAATGKLAGGMNNASRGVIDADQGNLIQQYTNLLEFINLKMGEIVGISAQRMGQISNRETVGGVERATLQSSHITEWLFLTHDDVKKRAIECFLETAKIAMKGRNKKFNYILPDNSKYLMNIDGDEFAECDYGLVVDSSTKTQELNQKLDVLAQAAMQNQTIDFSALMKLYNSCSLAEKQRMIENSEKAVQQRAQEQQQAQMQQQQQAAEMQMQMKQAEMEAEDTRNQRDNETKLEIALIQAQNNNEQDVDNNSVYDAELKTQELMAKMQEMDERLQLDKRKQDHTEEMDRARLAFDREKAEKDRELKRTQINKSSSKKS